MASLYHLNFEVRNKDFDSYVSGLLASLVKLLDWGEEGHRTEAEINSLRAAFTQEVAVWHKLDHPNVTKVMCLSLFFHFPQLLVDMLYHFIYCYKQIY